MALPVTRIISAVTPLVLGALELYQRRRAAKAAWSAPDENTDAPPENLPEPWRELQESDLEQSRLISELSRQVEALARSVEAAIQDKRRQDERIRRLLWAIGALSAVSFGLSCWLALR